MKIKENNSAFAQTRAESLSLRPRRVPRKKDTDFLYIYIHVPKCGGSTFTWHLRNNFRPKEIFNVYKTQPMLQPENGYKCMPTRADVDAYLDSLSQERKDEVSIIYGHNAYYGIHKYFNKTPRYITFFRNPVDRTLSLYNQCFRRSERLGKEAYLLKRPDAVDEFGEVLPFREWIKNHSNLTVNFFNPQYLDYDVSQEDLSEKNLEEAKEVLEKFYFVGMTESYESDVAYLYYQLGIKNYFKNRNVSKKYYFFKEDTTIRGLLDSYCDFDWDLYNHAAQLNKQFKKERKSFYFAAQQVKLRQFYRAPLQRLERVVKKIVN